MQLSPHLPESGTCRNQLVDHVQGMKVLQRWRDNFTRICKSKHKFYISAVLPRNVRRKKRQVAIWSADMKSLRGKRIQGRKREESKWKLFCSSVAARIRGVGAVDVALRQKQITYASADHHVCWAERLTILLQIAHEYIYLSSEIVKLSEPFTFASKMAFWLFFFRSRQ